MNALAFSRFLEILGALVVMKNGGEQNDVSKLLNYARLGLRAGDVGREYFEAAVAKVEQLVAEDRGLTELELADLDTAIRTKLARAAGVVLVEAPPKDPPAPPATDPPTEASPP